MALKKLYLENFTVFDHLEIEFCDGINVLIGENGTGKTHLLKILYSFYESDTLYQNSKLLFFETLSKCFLTEHFFTLFSHGSDRLKIAVDVNEKQYTYQASFYENSPEQTQLESPLDHVEITLQIAGQRTNEKIKSAFIPAKDMLTHSGIEKDYIERSIPFDKTLIDILFKSGMSELRALPSFTQSTLNIIKKMIGGTVLFEENQYYILHDGCKVSFQSEAEGFKKLAVLWRLTETGLLSKGSLLFWDEPEANINPKYIPALVDTLYALKESGVQIVLATHDYVLAKYIELKCKQVDAAHFHSLYYDNNRVIKVESNPLFKDLQKNSIAEAYDTLMDEIFEQTIRG